MQVTATVTDPTAAPYQFSWTITGETSPYTASGDSGGPAGTSYAFGFTPPKAGSYLVSVTATGSDGSSVSAMQVITAAAVAISGPTSGLEGVPITLTDSAADPNAAVPLVYTWTVNGSSPPSNHSSTFTFTPSGMGTYSVSLSVVDPSDGTSGSANASIAVSAVPPTAQILSVSSPATVGQAVMLTGSGSSGTTLSWSVFSSGAGGVIATGIGTSLTYTPSAAGTDLVTLTAKSGADGTSASTNAVLNITGSNTQVSPTLSITPTAQLLQAGSPATVDVSVNNPPSDTEGYNFNLTVTVTENGSPVSLTEIGGATSRRPSSSSRRRWPVPMS